MLMQRLEFGSETSEFSATITGFASTEQEREVCSMLVQCLGGEISLASLLGILKEHEEREGPLTPEVEVCHCYWCSVSGTPDPKWHPGGTALHTPPEPEPPTEPRIHVTVQVAGAPVKTGALIESGHTVSMVVESIQYDGGVPVGRIHVPLEVSAAISR